MDCKIDEVRYKSYNKDNTIYGRIMSPYDTSKVKGVLQISYGMCEYLERYDDFSEFMVQNGYVISCNDHLGHGKSVKSPDEYGFFGVKDGYKALIEDVHTMTTLTKKRFSGIPYFLFGHSMGSFISRCYASKYGDDINGLIICGTAGPNSLLNAGMQLADAILEKKGAKYRSRKLDQISFNFANINFRPVVNKYEWISRDIDVVKKRAIDERSSFIFTVAGFKDLFYLLKYCNDVRLMKKVPRNLPIYIFSGDKDPVGENGEGVRKVYESYKKIGCKDVTIDLYHDCRHELLNELNKKEVYNGILDWVELIRFGQE